MAEEQSAESKEFDPSQRRLDRAREEGDSVRSEELQAAVAASGLLLAFAGAGGYALSVWGGTAIAFLDRPQEMRLQSALLLPAVTAMTGPVLLLLLVPGIAVLVWLIASRGLVFAPSRIVPKPERLSIPANAKQKFGRAGLMDFARRALKLIVIGAVLALYLRASAGVLYTSLRMDAGQIGLAIVERMGGFAVLVILISLVFGLPDFIWQRAQFLRRNRMTRKEMTDEMKDAEGDPHMKADRRRRAQEVAGRQMMAEVPKADVVIVNPTHYAVALKWDRAGGRAPVCVAKGVDEIAARIREAAQEAGVPLRRDPPTARALHASTEIGQEIRREHYAAVAAAIRFATAMRRKAAKRRHG
ncbi:EscU/YscU/HrcU family type III secretion system export apparatus switch protein [Pseudogemmobacter sonorensis]|uniref:EscU/YscU/HrcU family type III secretion system export apparatus switch protein n=1 Tax=Pseudogemmobacter sonorensis TaxID=2989681 RepID=UPI00369D65F5